MLGLGIVVSFIIRIRLNLGLELGVRIMVIVRFSDIISVRFRVMAMVWD